MSTVLMPLMPLICVCVIYKGWQNNLAFSVRQIILVKISCSIDLLQDPELTTAGARMRKGKGYLWRQDKCRAIICSIHL